MKKEQRLNILSYKNSRECRMLPGFTLVELMTVVAIIGILASVVTVSMTGARDRSKKASALTTVSSVLPELVMCGEDDGFASTPSETDVICCSTAACGGNASGHTARWPNINSKTGWSYSGTSTGTVQSGDYVFTITKDGTAGTGDDLITCSMQDNECV